MKMDTKDYKFCIQIAIANAKERINLLDKTDQECILEEYNCLLYTSPSPRDS